MQNGRLEHVMHAIEAYLTRHPEAADSADGIARWWLRDVDAAVTVTEVCLALERLLDKGVVKARNLPDGREIYFAMHRGESTTMN